MGESKLKKDMLIKVSLSPSQRIALNSILNYVKRCGTCQTTASQGDNELQIKRFNQIFEDLDLHVIDDTPLAKQQELAKDINSYSDYEMRLEAARHLFSVLEKKIRFASAAPILLAPLLKELEDQLPKSAADMDAEATASEKPKVGRFLVSISPDDKQMLLSVFFSPAQCLTCAAFTDGPDTKADIALYSATFNSLGLMELFDKNLSELNQLKKEYPDNVDIEIDIDQANFLHSFVFRRIGFVPQAPRKLFKFMKVIEEIKSGSYDRKIKETVEFNNIVDESHPALSSMREENAV